MNYWFLLLVLLLLPACAGANDVYHIRKLSERELTATYESILLDACRHSDGEWHDWSVDPRGGHWGSGMSDGNEGIRAVSAMAFASGTLLRYCDELKGDERQECLRKATAALRYAVTTHVSGTQNCTDGKRWGGSWQSAMWTGVLGFGAWLMWDDLDLELRQGIERVVASEADRFTSKKPPTGRWFDTKAEENAWDATCISLAANMFPSHPHAPDWQQKAIEYMMNTLSAPRDLKDDTIVEGRPVKDWVLAPNCHPDFTLENHGFYHPGYVTCSCYMLGEDVMQYAFARRPIPQAATRHVEDSWLMLQTFMLSCGANTFPQGVDWEMHGLPTINLLAFLTTYIQDPLAAEMEAANLQYTRAWQNMAKGDLTCPGSRLGFTRHAITTEQTAWAYLAHKIWPRQDEVPAEPIYVEPSGVRSYSSIGVIAHRTESKLLTFSWKYRIMGMLVPSGAGHDGNPYFTFPLTNGFIGATELTPAGDAKVKVVERTWKKRLSGFETTGTLLTNGERLRQTLRITSVGEKAVVYQDRVTALSDVSVTRVLGAQIGIENDSLTGGTRTVHHQDGKTVFDWKKPQQPVKIRGSWAHVDGRVGVVQIAGSGLAYCQASGYNGQAVYADVLCGSYSDTPRDFKAGGEVAHRIVLYFTEVTPEETAVLARSVKIEGEPGNQVLRFRLPEGSEAEVSLLVDR